MATNVRDPRSIITPEAFEISRDLLGTPLGTPSKRLWAILIDLIVIGFLTVATASISLILWGAVAVFFITMAFRVPGRSFGQVTSILFRGATGCLGVVILFGVLIGYAASHSGGDLIEELAEGLDSSIDSESFADTPELAGILRGISAFANLAETEDPDVAAATLGQALRALGAAQMSEEETRALVDEIVPDEVVWAQDRDSVYAQAFRIAGVGTAPPEASDEPDASDGAAALELAESVAALSDTEAVQRWLQLRTTPDTILAIDPAATTELALLSARIVPLIAADTLEALDDRLDDAGDDLASAEERLAAAQAEIDAGQAGVLGLVRDIWDQAGSAIGLWSIYFTVALTVTGGRTVGKKVMGLRVLRLDGEPMNWWSSFERAGGYVAGIATGTLGFVQVFWDPNRQCVHDKIVGTVVVTDGAEIEPGAWQEAWAAQQRQASPDHPRADEPRENPRSHPANPDRAARRPDRDDRPGPPQPPPP